MAYVTSTAWSLAHQTVWENNKGDVLGGHNGFDKGFFSFCFKLGNVLGGLYSSLSNGACCSRAASQDTFQGPKKLGLGKRSAAAWKRTVQSGFSGAMGVRIEATREYLDILRNGMLWLRITTA
jgi:hypothetical protein